MKGSGCKDEQTSFVTQVALYSYDPLGHLQTGVQYSHLSVLSFMLVPGMHKFLQLQEWNSNPSLQNSKIN